jgi:hypothetical protein
MEKMRVIGSENVRLKLGRGEKIFYRVAVSLILQGKPYQVRGKNKLQRLLHSAVYQIISIALSDRVCLNKK